ncbi:MAG: hypothetical protein K9K79_01140 [Desulfohalobiaceae bacterium]|nr:hypothetical protein [Desulfohalobiaceae bacterium]
MDLENFIKETLVQISKGVSAANEQLTLKRKKEDGTELPKLFLLPPGSKKEQGHGVHFDVAITIKSAENGSGGVKVRLAVVDAELGGKLDSSHESVSRIQFSVNINQWHG